MLPITQGSRYLGDVENRWIIDRWGGQPAELKEGRVHPDCQLCELSSRMAGLSFWFEWWGMMQAILPEFAPYPQHLYALIAFGVLMGRPFG